MSQTPAGWFPDQNDPSQERYWDGTAWTGHRRPRQMPQQPGQTRPISPDGRFEWTGAAWVPRAQVPYVAPGKTGLSTTSILLIVGGCFLALALLVAIGVAVGGSDSQGGTSASDLATQDADASGIPADEATFLGVVADGQKATEAADGNEIKIVQAHQARSEALCKALPKTLEATNWVGVVETVETTLGGDGGVLSILVADDVAVGTWNNGLSDIGSGTVIDPESDLYDGLADLEEGDRVYFSGRFDGDSDECVTESSLVEENGMMTPDFIFRFTAVGLASDGPLPTSAAAPGESPADASSSDSEPTQTADPGPKPVISGDGTWLVPQDVKAGTYVTAGASSGCYFERVKNLTGTFGAIISNGGGDGQVILTIEPTDKALNTNDCGDWFPLASHQGIKGPRLPGDGIFAVGPDVRPGTYRASKPKGCYWERLSNFEGTFEGIIANGNQSVVQILPSDTGFSTNDCGEWTKIG